MANETKPVTTQPEPEIESAEISNNESPEGEGGKLLLGKKVLRHFGVRSDVQAGTYSGVVRCR